MLKSDFRAAKFLLVNTALKKLQFYERAKLVNSYPIAVGKPSTPTPTGEFKIVTKILNPGNGLGTRWLGLSIPNGHYGIHGTNIPSSVGKSISNGCIRMYNSDVEELFSLVSLKTPVLITDNAEEINLTPLNEEKNEHTEPPKTTTDEASTHSEEIPRLSAEEDEDAEKKEENAENNEMSANTQSTAELPAPEQHQAESVSAEPPHFIYTVRPGDTLWSIARSCGLPIQRLLEINDFADHNALFPGQKILIPAKARPPGFRWHPRR